MNVTVKEEPKRSYPNFLLHFVVSESCLNRSKKNKIALIRLPKPDYDMPSKDSLGPPTKPLFPDVVKQDQLQEGCVIIVVYLSKSEGEVSVFLILKQIDAIGAGIDTCGLLPAFARHESRK